MFVMRSAPVETFTSSIRSITPVTSIAVDRSRSFHFADPTFLPVVFSFTQDDNRHQKCKSLQSERCQIEVLEDSPKSKKKTKRPTQKSKLSEAELQQQFQMQSQTTSESESLSSTKKPIRSIPLIPPAFIQQQQQDTLSSSADFLDEATLQNLKEEPLKFVSTRQSLPFDVGYHHRTIVSADSLAAPSTNLADFSHQAF